MLQLWFVIVSAEVVASMVSMVISTLITSTRWYAKIAARISEKLVTECLKGDSQHGVSFLISRSKQRA